jgi:gluconate 2-dehydrogenase gamma chain
MNKEEQNRRWFLQGSGALAGTSALRFALPGLAALSQAACSARDEGAPFATLESAEGRELEAIAARILPSTDTPGAREAGVIWFFDKALGGFMADQVDFLRTGLAGFQAPVAAAYAGAERFSDLDDADQDAYLGSQEQTPFFGLVRFMTLAGMFGMSSYGGNKDGIGWKLLGVDPHQHGYQPPFGYYDAEFRRGVYNGD